MTYEDQAATEQQREMYANFLGPLSLAMAALWIIAVLIMLGAAYKGSTMNEAPAAAVDTNAPAATSEATPPAEPAAQ
ncbi:hypothetical protein [Devosia ginsengisoli]|uniref:Uncharacterized protein n=1 Tax=Devosia ginsengisoli TaxID=400770 RepID=A0A5B8LWW6_9HYPH|nr:hypothetical protein [Devosia ginsengisoli]QDZ12593.1 hypothetical protein FPZ08_18675 [Devosia ginsengisoli]